MSPSEREKVLQEAKKIAETGRSNTYNDERLTALYETVGLLIKVVEDLNAPGHPFRT